jgi:hypothetical protein
MAIESYVIGSGEMNRVEDKVGANHKWAIMLNCRIFVIRYSEEHQQICCIFSNS